jgi:hypothetical protein
MSNKVRVFYLEKKRKGKRKSEYEHMEIVRNPRLDR